MVAKSFLSFARIESRIDEVIRLLAVELRIHADEQWEGPCKRVSDMVGALVTLGEREQSPEHSRAPHGNLSFRSALSQNRVIVHADNWTFAFVWLDVQAAPDATSDTRETMDPLVERIIHEIDAQSRVREFVWAGHLTKFVLPQHGLTEPEAQRYLQKLVSEGVITTTKRPNPKNPNYPTACVALNMENELVRRVLAKPASTPTPSSSNVGGFEPIRLPGGPLSDDIIRDRGT